jgi:aspartyl-tRNA(Asn)/glutamyl-tRNA(Gln) amidotransferase subunit A
LDSLLQLAEKFRTRQLSPVEVTRDCLARIERLNPSLNAFITVMADPALAQAQAAEQKIGQGRWRGPLHGIPIGLKDLIDTAGVRTTAASAVFSDRVPAEDAEVVRRLEVAGAVILGKQNLHEFACGASTMVSHFGPVRNPWDPAHIAGGSSSGSAAAAAAGLGVAAIGTDTAGSIREPAAFCGVVGLKPTYGRVSARGVVPLSVSLDHVGPIARSVADAAVVLQAIAGHDSRDPASADQAVPDFSAGLSDSPKGLRVGIPQSYFFDGLDAEIASATAHALDVLRALGVEVREMQLSVPTDRTVQSAETFVYHSQWLSERADLYQPETLRRIRSGEAITHAELESMRRALSDERLRVAELFTPDHADAVDLIVTPATPVLPATIAELAERPEQLRARELAMLRNTRPFNVWGLPAISVPCGFSQAGLPIGLQIAGPHWREDLVLSLAHYYEQATAWHKRQPAK